MRSDNSNSVVVLPEDTALIVIDVQKGLDEPYWGTRNNPAAKQNIARLLAAWRQRGLPIYYLHHQSKNPNSPLRPQYVGNEIKISCSRRQANRFYRRRKTAPLSERIWKSGCAPAISAPWCSRGW